MTTYLTATQAATRLGKSEKTIRRWITEGRLHAHHPNGRKNMLAISEDDIEQLATELAQYEQQQPAASDLDQQATNVFIANMAARLATVEDSLRAAEQKIAALEAQLSVGTPAQPAAAETTRTRTRHTSVTPETILMSEQQLAPEQQRELERLPQGSTPHYIFADKHGVHRRTFHDHIKKGLVPAIVRQKTNRNEKAYWLTPEQQRAAIDYWRANDTTFHTCELCPHTDEIYQRASDQDQDASEDQQSAEAMM